MRLKSRRAALEAVAEGLIVQDTCDVCGFPAPGWPAVLALDAEERVPECTASSRRVDHAGHSVETVLDGRPLPGELIVLCPRTAPVQLPGMAD